MIPEYARRKLLDNNLKKYFGIKKFRPRNRLGLSFWLSLAWIILTTACAIFAGFLPLPEPDHMDWINQAALPGTRGEIPVPNDSGEEIQKQFVYLLGTDTMGRDIATRLIFGTRISLAIGLAVPAIGLVLGGILGMLAGFYRGKLETAVMATMDTILAFPNIVLLLAITFYLGSGLENIIIALGILVIPAFSHVARANTLNFAQREFVQAARMMGANDMYIMIGEILPNVIIPMAVYALMIVAYMIMAEGMLSFLGLGVPPPAPSWGSMIAEGKEMLDEAPHVSLLPAFAMFLTILSFNLIGDSLRNLFDKKEGQL